MRPVTQTRFGWPEGNCLMACVASILEVDLEALPDLYEAQQEREDGSWWNALHEALKERGWSCVYVGWDTDIAAPQGYAIAGGDSPREDVVNDKGENAGHTVVVKDGRVVHDPHPSRDGLGGTPNDYIVLLPPRPEREAEA